MTKQGRVGIWDIRYLYTIEWPDGFRTHQKVGDGLLSSLGAQWDVNHQIWRHSVNYNIQTRQ
jgi:hypothetical protein